MVSTSPHPNRKIAAALTAGALLPLAPLMVPTATATATAATTPSVKQAISATTTAGAVQLPAWTPQKDDLVLVGVAYQAYRNLSVAVSGNGLQFTKASTVRNAQG